jgi:hypothetical protein
MVLANGFFSRQGLEERPLVPFVEERKNFEHAFSEDVVQPQSRYALHRPVPGDQAQLAVKREDTIDAGIDESA